MTINITISRKPQIGIVRHRPRPELIAEDGSSFFVPSTVPLSEEPRNVGIADPILVTPQVWEYLQKINSPEGYRYCTSVGKMLDNRGDGRVVAIACGGNWITWDMETDTHVRVISRAVSESTSDLNPAIDNWFMKPERWWKACAVDGYGKIINVGEDLDVYFPLIHGDKRLWLAKSDLERFPQPPAGMSYQVRGGDVFGVQNGKLLPLLVKRQEFTDWFKLATVGVVAPA